MPNPGPKPASRPLAIGLAWLAGRATVVAMSAGWVNTDMGGVDTPREVADAVRSLLATIDALDDLCSGSLLDEQGVRCTGSGHPGVSARCPRSSAYRAGGDGAHRASASGPPRRRFDARDVRRRRPVQVLDRQVMRTPGALVATASAMHPMHVIGHGNQCCCARSKHPHRPATLGPALADLVIEAPIRRRSWNCVHNWHISHLRSCW